MTTDRIKEIQSKTAYPESVSVQQALLQVWNECEQEQLRLHNVVHRRELLLAAICEHNKFNTQKDIKAVDDWLEKWDSK